MNTWITTTTNARSAALTAVATAGLSPALMREIRQSMGNGGNIANILRPLVRSMILKAATFPLGERPQLIGAAVADSLRMALNRAVSCGNDVVEDHVACLISSMFHGTVE